MWGLYVTLFNITDYGIVSWSVMVLLFGDIALGCIGVGSIVSFILTAYVAVSLYLWGFLCHVHYPYGLCLMVYCGPLGLIASCILQCQDPKHLER